MFINKAEYQVLGSISGAAYSVQKVVLGNTGTATPGLPKY